MDSFLIKGGVPLHGEVEISGSKNAVLPIMAAALLTDEPCVIRRVPNLSDTRFMAQILESLGATAKFEQRHAHCPREIIRGFADYDLVRKMRGSICIAGPAAGPTAQGADFPARRLHHRRAAHQSAFERFRGARRENQNRRRLRGCARPKNCAARRCFSAGAPARRCSARRT